MPLSESRRLLTGAFACSAWANHSAISSRVIVSVRDPMGHSQIVRRHHHVLDGRRLESLQHLLAALRPPGVDVVDTGDLHLRHAQVERRALLHAAFTQRGQHVADVVQEHPVRADHEHTVAHQPAPVLEQEIGGTVQAHRGLAGTRTALHDQDLVQRSADDDVLLGLDGGHDLAHRARAGRSDLGEHRIGDARARRVVVGVVELLVAVRGQLTVGEGEATAMGQAERVGMRRPVERRRDRRSPVDHHRLVTVVLDVAATDVPPLGRCARRGGFGDPPEELARTRSAQVVERFGDRDLDVLLGDLVRGRVGIQPLEAFDHPVSGRTREPQVLLLGPELGEQVGRRLAVHRVRQLSAV